MRQFLLVLTGCLYLAQGLNIPHENLIEGIYLPKFEDEDRVNAPKPCCFPDQLQGTINMQLGVSARRPHLIEKSLKVFIDFKAKKIAGKLSNSGKSHNDTVGFIIVFNGDNTADGYYFNVDKQKCLKKHMPKATSRPQCIPANATYGGDFSLGPASGGLKVQAWSAKEFIDDYRGKMWVMWRALVVPQTCMPVYVQDHGLVRPPRADSEDFSGDVYDMNQGDDVDRDRPRPKHRGIGFVESVYYSDMKGKIDDPTVFTPPSYCSKVGGTVELEIYEEVADIVQKFVDF